MKTLPASSTPRLTGVVGSMTFTGDCWKLASKTHVVSNPECETVVEISEVGALFRVSRLQLNGRQLAGTLMSVQTRLAPRIVPQSMSVE